MSHTSTYKHKVKYLGTFLEIAKKAGAIIRKDDMEEGLTVKQFSRNEVHCFAGVKLPGWKYEIAITEEGEILYDHWGSEANTFEKLGNLVQAYNEQIIKEAIPYSEIENFNTAIQENGDIKMVLEYA